jgi:ubiquinone/menaquinone biosynthesis C-methylase UbiE
MAYDKKHIASLEVADGYNKLAKQYKEHHKHLDSFEKGVFLRFLPRDLSKKNVVDLWAWDGRLYRFFDGIKMWSYTACDIASDLLAQHPGKDVKKVVCDMEGALPFDDGYFAVALSFFVLEHVDNLQWLFQEVHRILEKDGEYIIGHFIQRRQFIHKLDGESFKINHIQHSPEEIRTIATEAGFTVHIEEIYEKTVLIGYILICIK